MAGRAELSTPQGSLARNDRTPVGPTKLADQVARRIEHDVIAAGWPIGMLLGSEADVLARYEVSRAVLREAVRIVEYLGIARMRRGPGGGLVVTEPDPSGVVTAVVVYLTYAQVRLEDVIEARRPIEVASAQLAAERATPEERAELQARLAVEISGGRDDHWVLHGLIAKLAQNPALSLFVEILSRITAQYQATHRPSPAIRRQQRAEAVAAHRTIVAAVSAGDGEAAARRMSRHLHSIETFLTGRQLERTLLFGDDVPDGDGKRGATIARRVFVDVVARGWPVDELLGSEGELMEQYEVSRAVLREAIRLLEFHRIVRTRRGPGGGILIAAPDVGATTAAMAVYLESRKITPEQLFEVRQAVELAAVGLAANCLDAAAIESLQQSLRNEQAEPPDALVSFSHGLHLRIAELTGNGAVQLFLHVLTRLTAQHSRSLDGDPNLTYEEGAARVHRAHAAIVKAIVAGDSDLARRRMQRHLEAITPMMS